MLNEAGCAVGLYCAETILSSPGHFGARHFYFVGILFCMCILVHGD
jgi:hypothetical protein